MIKNKIYRYTKNKIKNILFNNKINERKSSVYKELLSLRINHVNIIDNDINVEWIIFSKNRAIQLHAFISSYFKKVINPCTLNIIYTASNQSHKESYDELIEIFRNKNVNFIWETNFRSQLIKLLENISSSKIIFFCDDGLVTESFDMNDISKFNPLACVPSLYRGMDLTYCFAKQRKQDLPKFMDNIIPDQDKKVWIWKDIPNSPDWAYPLSVGGNLFSRHELLLMLNYIDFKGPNSLEAGLQCFLDIFNIRYGICYNKTPLGSIPANIVNSEILTNKTTNDLSADDLLYKWNQGYRIKYENYYGKNVEIIYQSKLEFVERVK